MLCEICVSNVAPGLQLQTKLLTWSRGQNTCSQHLLSSLEELLVYMCVNVHVHTGLYFTWLPYDGGIVKARVCDA